MYAGAGTSGRLGVLDAAECPPTFGVSPGQVVGVIAGGRRALWRAVEGAEDRGADARRALGRLRVGPRDVVCGICASGVTPFALAALREARRRGARTIAVTCAPSAALRALADVLVAPRPGPEVLAGSTRMKAGLATKMVLHTLTTGVMVRLGKVYGNLMVDLRPTSRKLRARALRIVAELTALPPASAPRPRSAGRRPARRGAGHAPARPRRGRGPAPPGRPRRRPALGARGATPVTADPLAAAPVAPDGEPAPGGRPDLRHERRRHRHRARRDPRGGGDDARPPPRLPDPAVRFGHCGRASWRSATPRRRSSCACTSVWARSSRRRRSVPSTGPGGRGSRSI